MFHNHDFLTEPRTTCQGRTGLPGCGAPIRWVKLAEKPHPIDPDPVPNGNLAVIECESGSSVHPRHAVVVQLSKVAIAAHDGPLYISHFATCKYADAFRRHRP